MIRSRPLKSNSFGALPVVSVLMIGSALIRFGDGGGQTVLASISEFTKAQASTEGERPSPEISTILSDLEQRQARLDAREGALDDREAELDTARDRMRNQLDEIAAAEAELQELLNLANDATQQDLGRLATVYENMKVGDAAALFTQMPPDFAAGFMGLMQPAAAAGIMSALPPENAYAISVMLAGRHANVQVE